MTYVAVMLLSLAVGGIVGWHLKALSQPWRPAPHAAALPSAPAAPAPASGIEQR